MIHLIAQGTDFTLVGILLSGIAALGGALVKLWTKFEQRFTTLEKKLDECEEDRQDLWRSMAKIDPTCKPRTDPTTQTT